MPSPTLRRAHVMAALGEGPSPCSTDKRQMVSPQRRRHATRTSTHPQFRWSGQVLTLERRYLIHCWRESDAGHEAVRQVGL